jgi:hypothetical protein
MRALTMDEVGYVSGGGALPGAIFGAGLGAAAEYFEANKDGHVTEEERIEIAIAAAIGAMGGVGFGAVVRDELRTAMRKAIERRSRRRRTKPKKSFDDETMTGDFEGLEDEGFIESDFLQ